MSASTLVFQPISTSMMPWNWTLLDTSTAYPSVMRLIVPASKKKHTLLTHRGRHPRLQFSIHVSAVIEISMRELEYDFFSDFYRPILIANSGSSEAALLRFLLVYSILVTALSLRLSELVLIIISECIIISDISTCLLFSVVPFSLLTLSTASAELSMKIWEW